jgi:competence protein ComEC
MLPTILPLLCTGWLVGVGWGSGFSPLLMRDMALVGSVGIAAVGVSRNVFGRALGVFLLAMLVGAAWADLAERRDTTRAQLWQRVAHRPVVAEGVVASRELHGSTARIRVRDVHIEEHAGVLPGLLQVSLSSEQAVGENARLRLIGKLQIPEERAAEAGAFDAERYFSRHHIAATMRYPKITVQEAERPSVLTRIRERLHENIREAVPEPSAGLLSAILLSFDEDLSPHLRDTFAASGVAHLIAISGSHIALIAWAAFVCGSAAGLRRPTAGVMTLLLSVVFLALVGFPASGVRSVIMAGIVWWAYVAGRRLHGVRALLLAAALMTVANPRILLGDIGFQLSVLAMWGLLALYPVLARPFRGRRDVLHLRTTLLLTLAAELATAPLVAWTFGRVSVIGLLANLAAIPLFPLLLGAGILCATVGTLPFVGALVVPVAHGVATAFLVLAHVAAETPGGVITFSRMPLAVLVGMSALLFLLPTIVSPRRPTAAVSPAVSRQGTH